MAKNRKAASVGDWPSFWDVAYQHGDHRDYWEPPSPPAELVAMVAAGVIAAGQTVLDVGCGSGVEAVFLAQHGCQVIGVDASEPALEHARAHARATGVEVDWRRGEAKDLPLADGAVDVVIDRGCLHVIARAGRRFYAAEIARVLCPGGFLLLRGAAQDDEEAGVVGLDVTGLDAMFPAPAFGRGPVLRLPLIARAETLAGHLVVVRKRGLSPVDEAPGE